MSSEFGFSFLTLVLCWKKWQSEDDGHGGRRKKGLKEKVKEKLPGHHDDRPEAVSTTTPGGYSSAEHEGHHEKKGIMEKIKEKLPGHH